MPQREKELYRIILSFGYIEVGEFEKAKHILQEVQTTFLDTTEGMFAMACYYNNYAVCLLNEKNVQGAAVALDHMERAIESERLTESERESLQQAYRIKRYLLDMLTGRLRRCDGIFPSAGRVRDHVAAGKGDRPVLAGADLPS